MSDRKFPTYNRNVQYTGHDNLEVIALEEEYRTTERKLRGIGSKLNEIRKNCVHTFLFSSSGMYEDNFVCSKCGQETER
jgi:hypothetical protein